MKFHIVTPSYNALDMLKLCIASVADQPSSGVEVHHHVQDGGSTDGTAEYLEQYLAESPTLNADDYTFSFVCEEDEGMYNAINRGWDRAADDVDLIAWLNCDEQYLPDTLSYVATKFEESPMLDLAFGDLLMLDGQGEFICFRKAHQPRWPMITADYLYTYSCTMFLKKTIFGSGIRLDEQYKAVADEDFVVRILKAGYRTKHFKHYLSVFACTGNNLSLAPHAREEAKALFDASPSWVRNGRGLLTKIRLMLKVLNGCYSEQAQLSYEIYDGSDLSVRKRRVVNHPQWKCTPFLGVD